MSLELLEGEVSGSRGYIRDVLDFDVAEIGVDKYKHNMIFKLKRKYRRAIKEAIPKGIVRAVSIVSGGEYCTKDCKFYNWYGVELKSLRPDAILKYVVLLDVRGFTELYKNIEA